MHKLKVEVDESSAMWSNNTFNCIQVFYLLRPGLRLAVGGQCEMGVPRDATAAHAVREQGFLLLIHGAQRE